MRYTYNYYQIEDDYKQRGVIPIDYVFIQGKGLVPNSDEIKALAKNTKLTKKIY